MRLSAVPRSRTSQRADPRRYRPETTMPTQQANQSNSFGSSELSLAEVNCSRDFRNGEQARQTGQHFARRFDAATRRDSALASGSWLIRAKLS